MRPQEWTTYNTTCWQPAYFGDAEPPPPPPPPPPKPDKPGDDEDDDTQ